MVVTIMNKETYYLMALLLKYMTVVIETFPLGRSIASCAYAEF